MVRTDGRAADELRPVRISTGVQRDPWGSVQIGTGHTVVICAANVSTKVPDWMAGKGKGWVTAEYSMMPGASPGRVPRVQKGRSEEIQRLVGRSLRAATDLPALGERLVTVDCDVLQADAGTRCASITGGYVALALAAERLRREGGTTAPVLRRRVCAVSCAVVDGVVVLDPDYSEDHRAEVDANFVFCDDGRLIEVQGTAEGEPFATSVLHEMLRLAWSGAERLFAAQAEALASISRG
jgi:ribonuclease PH